MTPLGSFLPLDLEDDEPGSLPRSGFFRKCRSACPGMDDAGSRGSNRIEGRSQAS
jgi:hypothetical protein